MRVTKEDVEKAREDVDKAGDDYDTAKAFDIDDIDDVDAAHKDIWGKYKKLRAAWNKYKKLRDEYEL